MPAPSLDTRKRRAQHAKKQKLNALVNGNGSLRIALRTLDNKAQQMLSDRLNFISKLGKGYVSTAFKGLVQHGSGNTGQNTVHAREQVPEVEEDDYGIQEFQIDVGGIESIMRGQSKRSSSHKHLQSSRRRNAGNNRIDDLKRIAALTRAGHQAIPGVSGKLYRPPKKEIRFSRAFHVEPFTNTCGSGGSGSGIGRRSQSTTNIQRPFTVPVGVRKVLPRRMHSRQRPRTGPHLGHGTSTNTQPLLLSANWEGLFAKQSRPGTAASSSSGIASLASSRPGTSGPPSHNHQRRGKSRGSQKRGESPGVPRPRTNPNPNQYHKKPQMHAKHTFHSRPGTAEHLDRARKRRNRRPMTGGTGGGTDKARVQNNGPRPKTSPSRQEKYWKHTHMITKRIDAKDDYVAAVQRLADTKLSCNLVGGGTIHVAPV